MVVSIHTLIKSLSLRVFYIFSNIFIITQKNNLIIFSTIITLAFAAGIYITVNTIELTEPKYYNPKPPTVNTIERNYDKESFDSWTIYKPTQYIDLIGKSATIQILKSQVLNWKIGSHSSVEIHGKYVNYIDYIDTGEISTKLKQYKLIIAVGAASKELKSKTNLNKAINLEEQRAVKRAEQLRIWLHQGLGNTIPIQPLSLGMRKDDNNTEKDTSYQRLIVLLGVIRMDEGCDLKSALYNNLNTKLDFPFKLSDYTKFELVDVQR